MLLFKKEDISRIQDELRDASGDKKSVANHALCVNLLGWSSYFEFHRAFIRDVQANLPEGQERYQDEYCAEEGGSAQAQKRPTR